MNSVRPIIGPTEHGLFPSAPLFDVPPLVLDANRLCQDLWRSCRAGERTVLITGANSGLFRLFCARHVVAEFNEHAEEWAADAKIDLERFMTRWTSDYLPLLRVLDPPPGLLTPPEADRIALLQNGPRRYRDPDDVPTATLALVLGAQLVSDDGRPLRAVYGPDAESAHFRGWVRTLMAGGDAGVLTQMQRSQEQAVGLAGHAAFSAFKVVWTKVHPVAAVLLGAAGAYAYRRASPSTRQHAAETVRTLIDNYNTVATSARHKTDAFLSAAAPVPSWSELADTLDREAVLLRACLYTVARRGTGDYSARELATALPALPVPQSEAKVRVTLRGSAAFHQHQRGRFQVGRPVAGPVVAGQVARAAW
jgi:predicted nucleic acid-binding protein